MDTWQEIADSPNEVLKELEEEAANHKDCVTIAINQDTLLENAELPKEQAKEG